MALTETEKAKIVLHLGWPAKTIIEGSTDYSRTFVSSLESLGTAFEEELRGLLTKLATLDTALEDAAGRLAVKSISDITLRDDELYQLTKEKKKILRQLSGLLDLELLVKGGSGGIGIII